MQQHHRPTPAPDYDTDFYAWTQHQAKLLRAAGRLAEVAPELDLAHVAEEIEDLGKAELRGATSLIRNVFVHLIKAASEPQSQAARHWRTEALTFAIDVAHYYTTSVRQLIDQDAIWMQARKVAESALEEHGGQLPAGIPKRCPYALAELVGDSFNVDAALARLTSAS